MTTSSAGFVCLLVLLALPVVPTELQAQTSMYVSPGGSGSKCSDKSPCSLAGAIDKVRTLAGSMSRDITVNLRGGWYMISKTVTIDAACSGRNGHKVIFQAAPGEYPVLSGGRRIKGWSLHHAGRKIWKAPAAGLETRQLYVNCVRAVRAHSGAGLPGARRTKTGYTTSDNTMQNWGNKSDIEFVYNALQGGTGGDGSSGWSSLWTERRIGVAKISGRSITMKEPAWDNSRNKDNKDMFAVSTPTDIENAYELLDEPGEWYLDRSADIVYYIPRSGEDLRTARVIAGELDGVLVSVAGTLGAPVRNIQFKGITFAHATWLRPSGNQGFPELQANYCHGGSDFPPAAVDVRTGRAVRFEGCVFKHLGATGLRLRNGSQDCTVEGCVFTDISGNCILVGKVGDPARKDTRAHDTRNSITNCYIHDAPCEYHGGCGIFAGYVSNLLVAHNEIGRTPYSAMSLGWGWGVNSYAQGNRFTANHAYKWCLKLDDGAAIYTLSELADPQGGNRSQLDHNYFHDMPRRRYGGALYPDKGSARIDIHHNVCANIPNNWIFFNNCPITNVNVYDNWVGPTNKVVNRCNSPMSNNRVVTNGNWPAAARAVMDNSGIQAGWAGVKILRCACSMENDATATAFPFRNGAGEHTLSNTFRVNVGGNGLRVYAAPQATAGVYNAQGKCAKMITIGQSGEAHLPRVSTGIYIVRINGSEVSGRKSMSRAWVVPGGSAIR